MKRFGVVMAGGGGTRFWPLSRRKNPKQFLNLTGKDVLINEAIDRLVPVSENGEVFVVTGTDQAKQLMKLAGERLRASHVLKEPAARNTAACIGLACVEIIEKYGDSVMMVVPSDPAIGDVKEFQRLLEAACEAAEEQDKIVTIGIKPTFACTGYGYIRGETEEGESDPGDGETGTKADIEAVPAEAGEAPEAGAEEMMDFPQSEPGRNDGKETAAEQKHCDVCRDKENCGNGGKEECEPPIPRQVIEFVEKPDQETAEKYLAAGCYYWNSGMFVFKASLMLSLFEELLPDVFEKLSQIRATVRTQAKEAVVRKVYPTIPKVSIDYGIMERAAARGKVLVLPGSFGWSDVGSFPEMAALHKADENGNITFGDTLELETKDCVLYSGSRMLAALGVKDLVVVETEDAVLVCHKDSTQKIGRIVEQLKSLERDELT